MTKEEFENIKILIRKRAKLDMLYIDSELEKYVKFGLLPQIPADPIHCAIMDYMIYGTREAKINVLRLLSEKIKEINNPLDAAFEMVCWLKENSKI